MKKLYHFGLPLNFVDLMQSYLENSKQHTIFNGITSTDANIIDGMPQGSILGLTLFLCYINDLTDNDIGCHLGLYADDTVLYLSDPCLDTLVCKVNASLEILTQWCLRNRLTINGSKTKAMLFSNSKQHSVNLKKVSQQLVLDGTQIEFVRFFTYLGNTIDDELKFSRHINRIISTASLKLITLSKIRFYITEEIAVTQYK